MGYNRNSFKPNKSISFLSTCIIFSGLIIGISLSPYPLKYKFMNNHIIKHNIKHKI